MPCRATQDRWVVVESSDKTWSTGEGNDIFTSCMQRGKHLKSFPLNHKAKLNFILFFLLELPNFVLICSMDISSITFIFFLFFFFFGKDYVLTFMHRYISFSSEIVLPKSPPPNSPYPNHQPPSTARSLENPQSTKVMPGRPLCQIVDPVLIRDPWPHTQAWTQAGLSNFFLGPFLWAPSWFLQGLSGAGRHAGRHPLGEGWLCPFSKGLGSLITGFYPSSFPRRSECAVTNSFVATQAAAVCHFHSHNKNEVSGQGHCPKVSFVI